MRVHSFHIPVMGIGYTVDTPAKVAQYGISSVISLVDDLLLEKMRGFYCSKFSIPFIPIERGEDDCRARRVTAYLNTIHTVVQRKFDELRNSAFEAGSELVRYLEMAFEGSELKQAYERLKTASSPAMVRELQQWIRQHLIIGSIDVNIMTKLDKVNYKGSEPLPIAFNDAHAALRGFARSTLDSAIVLSAGISQRLFSYLAEFDGFYADATGHIRKRITLKVSDYRSALVQGKALAQKGIWVSEFRIESGLNCGGHAFPTRGYLLGPILEEFRANRAELTAQLHALCMKARAKKGLAVFDQPLPLAVSVQGGVGTAQEHRFLLAHYGVDSVGWASPFLLVPEVTNVDAETLERLRGATDKELYLSRVSPIGVPFNNLRGSSKNRERLELIEAGQPGSLCPKQHLALNSEFGDRALCTASRRYQQQKLHELDGLTLSETERATRRETILEKECICVGLGTAALIKNDVERRVEGDTVSICPGPAVAAFKNIYELPRMVDHIYGRASLIDSDNRPHMFMRELDMYVTYLEAEVASSAQDRPADQTAYFTGFRDNLLDGIGYYEALFGTMTDLPDAVAQKSRSVCAEMRSRLAGLAV